MRVRFRLLSLGMVVVAGALVPAASAVAAPARQYVKYGISNYDATIVGLPTLKAAATASVLAPTTWKVLARKKGSITLLTDKRDCPYRVTFTARWATGATATALDHVTAALPAALPAYVEDFGTRRSYAWRVTRAPDTQAISGLQAVGMQQVRAMNGTVKFPGLPAGQSVWRELAVAAPKAKPAVRCHSGNYREVARQIGDALADNVTSFK